MEKISITERKAAHCLQAAKYHIVWLTKHRKPILKGNIAKRVQMLVDTICRKYQADIIAEHVGEDYIHLLAAVPPGLPAGGLVRQLKEETSRELSKEYSGLKKQYWGRSLWARGAFIIGNEEAENEYIAKYIKAKV